VVGEVVAKRDTPQQCWANLRLENGDRVIILVAPSCVRLLNIPTAPSWVKVLKMKWAGMLPVATLWKSKSIAEIEEKFLDEGKPFQRPLDSIIDKLIDCRSAADVAGVAPMLTPTRPGSIGLCREFRCRFLRTALAQRITLCSEIITLPGPVTVIARSALAFLDWLLDHHAQPLSRLQTSKTILEASPACLH
jgi:hypothetical protein